MRRISLFLALAAVTACAPTGEFMSEVPEEVRAVAAPNQNLQSVKLLEEDGCYWYEHVGPVETTMLPLRGTNGGHICSQQQG